jgi:HEAT repeat protein/beta-lactamase regulating signal transducer with metallopeptidase domain
MTMPEVVLSWLLTYAVHSTVLIGGVALLTWRLVQSHAVREVLGKTALVGGLVTASLQVGLGLRPVAGRFDLAAARPSAPAPLVVESSPSDVTPAPEQAAPRPHVSRRTRTPEASIQRSTPASRSITLPWTTVVLLSWAGIAGVMVLGFVLARLRLARHFGPRRPVVEGPLPPLLQSLCHAAGIRRPIRLTSAPGLGSPVALGLSEICIPDAALIELDREQQRSMLAHELAHLARLDPLWLTLACLLERPLFFQPLNRLARRRMQDAAEYLCDDWAVHRTGSGLTLAKCLVKVAEWMDNSPRAVPVSGMAEHRSQLVARIHRLVEDRNMITQFQRRWLAPLVILPLGLTAMLAPGFTAAGSATLDAQQPAPRPAPAPAPAVAPSAVAAPIATPALVAPAAAPLIGTKAQLARLNAQLARASARMTRASTLATQAQLERASAQLARVMVSSRSHGSGDTVSTVVPALIAALKDADPKVRTAAAQSLGELEDPRAIPGLIEASHDADAEVRSAALQSLSRFDDPRVVDPMILALKDPNRDVRQNAAQSLGRFNDPRAVRPLMAALADSSADVRMSAAQSLGELHDPQALPGLAGALKDPKADVRQAAAQSLGELELKSAPQVLIDALADPDADVRQAVAQTLGEIQDPHAVPGLAARLNDSNGDVRESAVSALSEIGDAAAINALVGALKSSDPDVRRRAAQALGQRQ